MKISFFLILVFSFICFDSLGQNSQSNGKTNDAAEAQALLLFGNYEQAIKKYLEIINYYDLERSEIRMYYGRIGECNYMLKD